MDGLNGLPHFDMTVGELEDEENIFTTSLVTNPATDMKIQVFSTVDTKSKITDRAVKFAKMPATDEYERVISGVWMMPDTKYYRVYNDFEFTVSFSKQELKKALVNYLKNDNADSFDYQHNGKPLNDLISIEHWIIESKETRSPVMGYSLAELGYLSEEIPTGTVMKSVYIKDEAFFNEMVLSGNVMGYSIEGLFNLNESDTMVTEQFSRVNMFKSLGLSQTSGTIITNDGNLSFTKNGIALNDVRVTEGEYQTKAGFNIVIKKGTVVDFGFEVAQAIVAVDSAQVEQVETPVIPAVAVQAPVAPVVAPVTVPVAPVAAVVDVAPVVVAEPVVEAPVVVDAANEALMAELAALKDKLAAETKLKEDLMKAQPIPAKVLAPAMADMDNYIVRVKGGVSHYIPKR